MSGLFFQLFTSEAMNYNYTNIHACMAKTVIQVRREGVSRGLNSSG